MKRRIISAVSVLAISGAVLATAGLATVSSAEGATSQPPSTGTVIKATPSPYGSILAVGSGQFSGYSVYLFNRDQPEHIACTTTVVAAVKVSCAGSETDTTADWPAVMTTGAPVPGPGVNHRLLGSTYRKDLHGRQVTYAGHPLYLFDMGPHQFAGENFVESVLPLPPWHGVWYLVSPKNGLPAAAQASITPQTLVSGEVVVSAMMFPAVGATAFTTYSYSRDTPHHSMCTGACAMVWPPVLTTGSPQVTGGLPKGSVGQIVRPDGTHQVTYHGRPLYFYSKELPRVDANGTPLNPATTGNGNKLAAPSHDGGDFNLIAAP
jgi:predicted lipoprotein with Yx(FWY)xxD motif